MRSCLKQIKSLHHQLGFTALELIVVLTVALAMLGLSAQYLSHYADNLINQAAADHMNTVSDAATRYIKDNYAVILALASPGRPATVSVSMLKRAGYLPTSVAEKNPFAQDYQILSVKPSSNKLETLIVTSRGETISEINIRRIAQLIGARGGFISAKDVTHAQGSYGGWQMTLSAYRALPGAGHLASALFFDEGALVNDYLYRSSVAEHPELNQMNTAIDMAGHNLDQVAQLNVEKVVASDSINADKDMTAGGSINAAQAKIEGDTFTGGWFRTTGDSGWYNQKWQGGWYMSDPDWVRSYANKNIFTGGQIQAGAMRSQGRLESGEYIQIDGVAASGQPCTPNGLLGRDANGLVLSCQSGIWSSVGDSGQIYRGYRQECPAGKIPLAKHWIQREAWSGCGEGCALHCGLPAGWGSNMNPTCEACLDFERCHILSSTEWDAVYCK